MKQHIDTIRNIALAVLVQRVSGWLIDQYVMPQVEKLPTKKKKPFGFAAEPGR